MSLRCAAVTRAQNPGSRRPLWSGASPLILFVRCLVLPDTETLKSLLSDLQTSGAGSRLRVATRTIESMRVELLAEVVRLRERLATVEKERDDIRIGYNNTTWERAKARDERDEARAEVERLRELVSPTTPAGKLTAYWAAGEIRKNPPKVAEWTGDGWRSCTGEVVAMVGDAGYMICRGPRIPDGTNYTPGTPDDCKNALRAAGWELAGGTE